MSRATVWTPLAALLLAALLLAGCGGDSGTNVSKDAYDLLQHELDTALAEITRLTTERDAALAKVKELEDDLEQAGDDLDDVRADLTDARADLARVQGQLTEARRQLGVAEEERDEAQEQALQAQQEADRRIKEAETQADVNVRAGRYLAGISDGGTARAVTVTHERGSTLTINPVGNFERGSGAPSISGFTARTYTRDVVNSEQTVFLYTNIQAPGTRAFWKIHGLEVDGAQDDAAQSPTPTAAPLADNAGTPTKTTVSGTYNGVSGTFTCQSTNCAGDVEFVSGTSGPRRFTATAGAWDFKPSNIASGVRQMRDNEHLFFGIWVNEPNLPSGTHDYEYITGGLGTLTNIGDLAGTATFTGGAVGKYVTRNQVGEDARIGTFTAAANLTADFTADTLEGRITNFRDGSQQLAGWNVYLGGTATDPVTGFTGTVTGGAASTSGTATASIGGVSATGEWGATLYGTTNNNLGYDSGSPPGTRDLTKYPLASYPLADLAGVVGNFHAISTAADGTAQSADDATAALAGAFGAACTSGPCAR